MASHANLTTTTTTPHHPPRDSLELASLASSTHSHNRSRRTSTSSTASSSSGAPSSRHLSNLSSPALSNGAGAGPRHHRSWSAVSSQFDFSSNLFPLSTSAGGYTALGTGAGGGGDGTRGGRLGGASLEKHKRLTYLNGLSLVVGLIIGSGVFSSPSQVNGNAGSPGASLIVWAVAGLLAWTGAASYAELGGAIPLNGGAQVYLAKIFGECAGFLFTWDAVFVLKPGSGAIIAIIFGEYVVRAAVGADARDVSVWLNKGVALAGLLLVTLLNCVSTKLGTRSADVFMLFKFVALLGVTVTGVVVAVTGLSYTGEADREWKTQGWFEGTSTSVSKWAVALYAGLWAFDGWDNTNYVTGEFVNPSRDLPRVIHTSLPLVILSYLLANLAYFFVLPSSVIASTNTVAVAFGAQVFGPLGSFFLALTVAGSCFGALNASTFTSGRLVCAAAREGYLPSFLGHIGLGTRSPLRLHAGGRSSTTSTSTSRPRAAGAVAALIADADDDDDDAALLFFTPVNAMALNAALTAAYILAGEFATLLTFYGVAGYAFYFVTVLGLVVLRVREPLLDRSYRTCIATPVVFCCVSLFLLSRAVVADPAQTAVVVAFTACGVPVYYWRIKRKGRGRGRERESGSALKGAGWRFWKRWRRT